MGSGGIVNISGVDMGSGGIVNVASSLSCAFA
jgi:hypothetical protein